MNIKYQVGKDDELKCSKEEQENNKENEVLEEEKGKKEQAKLEEIKELGNTNMNCVDQSIQILPIIGQIEGHVVLPPQTKATKYEHIIPQLISMEQNDKVKGVLIVLNTVGGDVEAGLAISEMIYSLSKPTVSIVIGGGHSIGVPLATSADYSFITPSATMIVHPVRMNGFVIGVAQTFHYFKKMQERINNFIVRTSKIDKEELERMMLKPDELLNDMGTMLIGEQAVECGLIDKVGGLKDALDKLNELIKEMKITDIDKMQDIKLLLNYCKRMSSLVISSYNKEKYDNKRLEIIINEMLIEAQALGINGVLKTNNFEISSGETANIYEIIFETIMKFRETNFILYIQVNNLYTEIKYLFDSKHKNFKKEIEKLQLEKLLKIEQIVDEDGTTIKLKILRGEN